MIKVICLKYLDFDDEENIVNPQLSIKFLINSYYLLNLMEKSEKSICNYYMSSIDGKYMINLTQSEFEENFIEVSKWREKQIDEILN